MRKAFLSMMLFLLIGFTASAQYTLKKQVVGTGGFSGQHINATRIISGIFGQPVVGIAHPTSDRTMYSGFWNALADTTSIEEMVVTNGVANFPNPVSSFTIFKFELKEGANVTLNVYNNLGMLIATVAQNEFLPAGQNSIEWDINKTSHGRAINSGSYMYEVMVVPASARAYSFRNILMISK